MKLEQFENSISTKEEKIFNFLADIGFNYAESTYIKRNHKNNYGIMITFEYNVMPPRETDTRLNIFVLDRNSKGEVEKMADCEIFINRKKIMSVEISTGGEDLEKFSDNLEINIA